MPGLRTRREAVAWLRISFRTLDDHVDTGASAMLIGHGRERQRRLFTDADLDAFVASQTRA